MPDRFDLFDMEFDEVSLVPSGDNPGAEIVLSKAYFASNKTGRKSGGGRHHQDGWLRTPHVFKDKGDGACKLCDSAHDHDIHKERSAPPKSGTLTIRAWIEKNKAPETIAEFVHAHQTQKIDRRTLRRVTKRDSHGRIVKSVI